MEHLPIVYIKRMTSTGAIEGVENRDSKHGGCVNTATLLEVKLTV